MFHFTFICVYDLMNVGLYVNNTRNDENTRRIRWKTPERSKTEKPQTQE